MIISNSVPPVNFSKLEEGFSLFLSAKKAYEVIWRIICYPLNLIAQLFAKPSPALHTPSLPSTSSKVKAYKREMTYLATLGGVSLAGLYFYKNLTVSQEDPATLPLGAIVTRGSLFLVGAYVIYKIKTSNFIFSSNSVVNDLKKETNVTVGESSSSVGNSSDKETNSAQETGSVATGQRTIISGPASSITLLQTRISMRNQIKKYTTKEGYTEEKMKFLQDQAKSNRPASIDSFVGYQAALESIGEKFTSESTKSINERIEFIRKRVSERDFANYNTEYLELYDLLVAMQAYPNTVVY